MLYNETKKTVVAADLQIADNFFKRFKGLMLRKRLGESEGLMLPGCASIHTCFMCFAIDAVFLGMDYRVINIKEKIKPWRLAGFVKGAYITVELPSGTVKKKDVSIGDLLILK